MSEGQKSQFFQQFYPTAHLFHIQFRALQLELGQLHGGPARLDRLLIELRPDPVDLQTISDHGESSGPLDDPFGEETVLIEGFIDLNFHRLGGLGEELVLLLTMLTDLHVAREQIGELGLSATDDRALGSQFL